MRQASAVMLLCKTSHGSHDSLLIDRVIMVHTEFERHIKRGKRFGVVSLTQLCQEAATSFTWSIV
jgi:hypothetical protein